MNKIFFRLRLKIFNLISHYLLSMKLSQGVSFRGVLHILVHKKAKISMEKNSVINCINFGYDINMHSKCKLYADRENSSTVMGENTRIHGACIHAYSTITIEDNCSIAANTQIIDGNGHQLLMDKPWERISKSDEGKPIVIKKNVWIAANCIILGGPTKGEGSVITAGSVVKGIVPANCIFGGNPAKLIKQY